MLFVLFCYLSLLQLKILCVIWLRAMETTDHFVISSMFIWLGGFSIDTGGFTNFKFFLLDEPRNEFQGEKK